MNANEFHEISSILLEKLVDRISKETLEDIAVYKDCGEEELMLDILTGCVYSDRVALYRDEWQMLRDLLYDREELSERDRDHHPNIVIRDKILEEIQLLED